MEKHSNQVDKLFAQKLEQHSSTPRPEAWQKLQAKLATEKKGAAPMPWFRLSLAASILMLFAIGLPFYMKTKPKPKAKLPLAQIEQSAPKQVATGKVQEPNVIRGAAIAFAVKNNTQAQKLSTDKPEPNTANITSPISAPVIEIPDKIIETTIAMVDGPIKTEDPIVKTANPVTSPSKTETSNADQELTVVFTLADYQIENPIENKTENIEPAKKDKYINKLFRQLRNAKNGAPVDWQEVGFKPAKILARAESKIRNTENEVKESYYTTKDKTIF